ncbi:hypothetical protein AMAG_03562 [Allomyces macrogynus ATCC 38327]|uniref:Uncharacterized protein n=1 Tax=Allomyces macrogynus (strain ATCC 38327) TaxID=578462 RepID=A0A0L0S9W4_ALLM3|nr:hypothetical protein AMAG_03562 [Allomyces macrogynus ATCC 38327]|eukprot:KNE59251.1 hypothetical protein AMAG_03562 [Allomyces macrogynus ATCC 38327]
MMVRNTKPAPRAGGGSSKVVPIATPRQQHHAPAPVRQVVEPKFEPETEPDHDPDEADYYSDDFDEYDDDDFEAYEEDDAIETHDHAADDLDAKVEISLRTTVGVVDATKGRTGSSPNGEAGSASTVPAAAGKSPSFRAAPNAKGASATSAVASARVQNVLKWVTLTYVGATLLDLAPKSEYDVSLLSSARLARAHCEAQAAPDTVDAPAQTDAWAVREVQIQVPDDQERPSVTISTTSAGTDGQVHGRSKKKSKKGADPSASGIFHCTLLSN